jgi:hypothetical protein
MERFMSTPFFNTGLLTPTTVHYPHTMVETGGTVCQDLRREIVVPMGFVA